jgi:hypothetical protein
MHGATIKIVIYVVWGKRALKIFCEQERTGTLFSFDKVMAVCCPLSSYVANSLWL